MLSESARATTTAEARFRVKTPNSTPRQVKIIALDRDSEPVVQRLSQMKWSRASFLTASSFAGDVTAQKTFSMNGWLIDLAGRTKNLLNEVVQADLVVMIASMGQPATAAAIIGEACRAHNVMTTALVLNMTQPGGAADTLAQLRPYANMLVAANSQDYIEDMLTALRA
ncbi:MAG TPA: hypothetical protein VM867_13975 [Xanthobacteraceae bacterium]|nr:hypothetical protein [Xanthobacteraceae bacterium]